MAINAPVIINPLTLDKAQMMHDKALSLFFASELYRKNSSWMRISPGFKVDIQISFRMFSRAGCAWTNKIKLNARLLGSVDDKHQYNTVSHELAHCVDYAVHGKSHHHGEPWELIHLAMGGTAERCHFMDTTGLRRTQPLHVIQRLTDGKLLKVKTRTANKVKLHPNWYPDYRYIGPVNSP